MATICCASTSRGASGMTSASSSPDSTARTRAAHSMSSSRVVAKMRPFGIAPRQCPARPMRCSITAIERGEPIWQTRSMCPTSIPSSSDAVATRARNSPLRKRDSACRRNLRERLPWCAATASSPRRSARECAMRSAIARVFTKISVERCCSVNCASRS